MNNVQTSTVKSKQDKNYVTRKTIKTQSSLQIDDETPNHNETNIYQIDQQVHN